MFKVVGLEVATGKGAVRSSTFDVRRCAHWKVLLPLSVTLRPSDLRGEKNT
jgi:hypothetical protein